MNGDLSIGIANIFSTGFLTRFVIDPRNSHRPVNRFERRKHFDAKRYSRAKESSALYFCWMYGCARLLSTEAPELNSQITLPLFSLDDEGPVLTRISIFLLLFPTSPSCLSFPPFCFKLFRNGISAKEFLVPPFDYAHN